MATCRCPHCNAQLKLPDSAKVVRAKCRACGHVFVIESTDIPPILTELVLISRTRRYRTLGMAVAVALVLVAGTALSNRYWGNLKDSHSQPIATSPDSSSPHAQKESEPDKIATGPQEIGLPKQTSPVSESLGDVVAPKLPPTQASTHSLISHATKPRCLLCLNDLFLTSFDLNNMSSRCEAISSLGTSNQKRRKRQPSSLP